MDVITVTMLGVLRESFEEWLTQRRLVLERLPDAEPGQYLVVPHPDVIAGRSEPNDRAGDGHDHHA